MAGNAEVAPIDTVAPETPADTLATEQQTTAE